jgi:hypothetical protein
MDVDFRIDGDDNTAKLIGRIPAILAHLMKKAVEDIAGQVEDFAKAEAPVGETGMLSESPVQRDSFVDRQARIKGRLASGRDLIIGISVSDRPRYAKWVHDGTGIYGPRKQRITPVKAKFMTFDAYGQSWRLSSVKGQRPNPFLLRAYEDVNIYYVPARIQYLRRQIDFLT